MAKYDAPEHTMGDVMAALPENGSSDVVYALRVWPEPGRKGLQVCVELTYVDRNGRTTVYKRWGERIGLAKGATVVGAWYRSAMRAYMEVGETSATDLRKLVLWECDRPS